MMMKFLSEKDVRRWWRDEAKAAGEGKCLFWVEPKAGSTFGFPDLLYAKNGMLLPFELKIGELKGDALIWKQRAIQSVCSAKMMSVGIDVFTFVGVQNTNKIALLHTSQSFLGKSTIWQEISCFREIWEKARPGSKFLFSSSS